MQHQQTPPSSFEAWDAYNGGNHAREALLSSKIPSHDKDEYCDRDCSNRQSKFNIPHIHDDNHKLDGEPEEKEKVEFEKGDVDLRAQISGLGDRSSSCSMYLIC